MKEKSLLSLKCADMIKINNRRYIGNKSKLVEHIYSCLPEEYKKNNLVFGDFFAGTGSVAHFFASKGYSLIINDILYSNYIAYKAWFNHSSYDKIKLNEIYAYLNAIKYNEIEINYFSDIYGGKYFSQNDAKKIGFIREFIENKKKSLSDREYSILLTSLLYAADRIANTVGHFEYFLKAQPVDTEFQLEPLDILPISGVVEIFNEDANKLVKHKRCDIAYIDPPYNARQYINFYHVLENLARWNKPTEFDGNSMKFKRDWLKSGYSRAEAPILFDDLVQSLDCKVIIVSYNNTYSAKSAASINKITEEQLQNILNKKGKTTKVAIDYSAFNAGKTNLEKHKEYIFTCEVYK